MKVKRETRQRNSQPLSVVDLEDALLTIATTGAVTGMGKTKVYEKIRSGDFETVREGLRWTRVRGRSVKAWMARK